MSLPFRCLPVCTEAHRGCLCGVLVHSFLYSYAFSIIINCRKWWRWQYAYLCLGCKCCLASGVPVRRWTFDSSKDFTGSLLSLQDLADRNYLSLQLDGRRGGAKCKLEEQNARERRSRFSRGGYQAAQISCPPLSLPLSVSPFLPFSGPVGES